MGFNSGFKGLINRDSDI